MRCRVAAGGSNEVAGARGSRPWMLVAVALTAGGCVHPEARAVDLGRAPESSQADAPGEAARPEAPAASLEWEHSLSTPGDWVGVLVLPDSSGGVVVVTRLGPIQLATRDDADLEAIAFDSQGRIRYTVPYVTAGDRLDREATAACLDDDGTLVIVGEKSVEKDDGSYSHEAVFLARYDAQGHRLSQREYPARYSRALTVFPMGSDRIGLVITVSAEVHMGAHVLADPRATTRTIPQAGTNFWVVLDRRGEVVFSRDLGHVALWVVPDLTGVTFVDSHAGQQGTHRRCRTLGWNATRWSFEGALRWRQDLETPLEFVLPRVEGGLFAATLSCSDPCRHSSNPPTCPDPKAGAARARPRGDHRRPSPLG